MPTTFFIRHKLHCSKMILRDLWSKRLIAIHYDNIPSASYLDYEGPGRSAIRRLSVACRGALVGATYPIIEPSRILVGEIPKGSKIEVAIYGDLIYKTVQLVNVLEVSYRDYPLLAAIQPRGTITRWPSAEILVGAILGKGYVPWNVRSLDPSQLEILCYEFLRMKNLLLVLLLPIGRTLMDIDILGLTQK